jgi:hypothetical protein
VSPDSYGCRSRVNDSYGHERGHLGGTGGRRIGFCQIQWVNSTPPLSSYNRFTCLEVDTPIEPFICDANRTEVVQTHSHPPTPPIPNRRSHLPAWECRLPIKYVVAASPGPMSLAVEVEIESTVIRHRHPLHAAPSTRGTLYTRRPKPAEAFRRISVKYAEC